MHPLVVCLFLQVYYLRCYTTELHKNDDIKVDIVPLDAPFLELCNGGLGIFVTILVYWQINCFVRLFLASNPAIQGRGLSFSLTEIMTTVYQKKVKRIILASTVRKITGKIQHIIGIDNNWTITKRSSEKGHQWVWPFACFFYLCLNILSLIFWTNF